MPGVFLTRLPLVKFNLFQIILLVLDILLLIDVHRVGELSCLCHSEDPQGRW